MEKGGGGAGKEAWGWIGKGFLFAGAGRGPGPWSARALRAPIFSLSQNSRLRGLLPSGLAHFSKSKSKSLILEISMAPASSLGAPPCTRFIRSAPSSPTGSLVSAKISSFVSYRNNRHPDLSFSSTSLSQSPVPPGGPLQSSTRVPLSTPLSSADSALSAKASSPILPQDYRHPDFGSSSASLSAPYVPPGGPLSSSAPQSPDPAFSSADAALSTKASSPILP